jgi:hypothetical protein
VAARTDRRTNLANCKQLPPDQESDFSEINKVEENSSNCFLLISGWARKRFQERAQIAKHGDSTMKLAWAFCFLIILGSSAIAAHAQTPIDPSVIINRGTGYPACSAAPPTQCFDGKNPIVESFNNGMFSFDFAYTNTHKDLLKLILKITGVPEGTPYTCHSDIWSECDIKIPKPDKEDPGVEPPELVTVTFTLSGEDATHTGFLPKFVPGQPPATFGVDELAPLSGTPEPGTWVLFATGIFAFALIGYGRRCSVATPLT